MTKLKLLLPALIAAAMLTTPLMARENHPNARHLAESAYNGATPGGRYIDGHSCKLAPRVGAFATQPWDSGPPCEPAPGY
jgi:hypothetical protein